MILTLLIGIDNLNLSIFWTFVVIDDKGEEIVYKDSEKITNGKKLRNWHRGEIWQSKGSIKILSTQVGGASS